MQVKESLDILIPKTLPQSGEHVFLTKYRLVHPGNHFENFLNTIFLGSKYPKRVLFIFENTKPLVGRNSYVVFTLCLIPISVPPCVHSYRIGPLVLASFGYGFGSVPCFIWSGS